MTRLIIVRHAEAEGNLIRKFQGHMDGDVTENGMEQLKYLKKRFENIPYDAIYSSDLKRAYKTALAVRGDRDMEIIKDKRLREIHGGDWEGKSWSEINQKWSDLFVKWQMEPQNFIMPNGESMEQMQNRIYDAVYDIYSKNMGKTVCIVFHGTAIKAFLCRLKGFCLNRMIDVGWCDNTGVTIIDFESWEKPEFVLEADISHLPKELSTFERQGNWHKDPTIPLKHDQR